LLPLIEVAVVAVEFAHESLAIRLCALVSLRIFSFQFGPKTTEQRKPTRNKAKVAFVKAIEVQADVGGTASMRLKEASA